MQLSLQKTQQDYELKVAQLQQQVQDLVVKYQTQSNIDSQHNAKDIALANINNSAKERVAMIQVGAQLDQTQTQIEHEQNMSALEATLAAEQDIRQHGLAVQQQAFEQQASHVQNQIEAQHQAAMTQQQQEQAAQEHQQSLMQADQQHQQQMQQADQQHQQQMEQQTASQEQQTPPTGAQ
jgi:hypothetical protein